MDYLGNAMYAACSAAFVLLIILMLLRGRVSGAGAAIAGACALTAVWAANLALPGLFPVAADPVLDSLRLSAWLILMVVLVGPQADRNGKVALLPFLLTIGFCIVVVGCELMFLIANGVASDHANRVHDFLRVGLGIGGLLATENLLRNAEGIRRRNLWPLCLALGGTFAFELFLYADRLVIPSAEPVMVGGRALVGLLAVPLLALAMARNRDWRVDIHVSRAVVLHTAALIASGLFFLALAALAAIVRQLGGAWGSTLQLFTLLGAVVVLASVFGSREVRVELKQFIARHFFSHRFDYRTEWLRFAATVSRQRGKRDVLFVRVIRAMAQIVDSPSGTLWCLRDGYYVFEAGWNLNGKGDQRISATDPFVVGFRGGGWIQVGTGDRKQNWSLDFSDAWLAIPLSHGDEMVAFVVLSRPSQSYYLDPETFNLLRAAGTQAASYLAEEQSTRALLDSVLMNEYSKRFAFVIHDIKNMASQLGLVVGNARHHLEDPAFRRDMMLTLEDSVARMERLIAQLRSEDGQVSTEIIQPDAVITHLVRELSAVGTQVETRLAADACRIAINADQFRSMLFHLINNAREAARPETPVVVSSCKTRDKITIEIVDDGPGMDAEFIREELFRPFHSTKIDGLGIGAYQTREILKTSGGELEVISKKGVGTTMRVIFPVYDPILSIASSA
jgi:putative PEP-CTERM system histidine kinase